MDTTNQGRFVWYDHLTRDVPAAIDFYGAVAGWGTQPFGDGGYTMWVGSQGPLGGVMQLPEELARAGVPPHWMAHVLVDDVDATAARAAALGGGIRKEPTDIPTVGRFSIIADPQGAVLSAFRPSGAMPLHDPANEGEICWNELLTTDAAAGFRFHAQLFGWRILQELDMGPMGAYRIYGVGDRALGGMMTLPKDARMPPTWMFYVMSGDLEAALGRATSRRATVTNGPVPVPGGGRIAQLRDPQGAAFALHQAPAAK